MFSTSFVVAGFWVMFKTRCFKRYRSRYQDMNLHFSGLNTPGVSFYGVSSLKMGHYVSTTNQSPRCFTKVRQTDTIKKVKKNTVDQFIQCSNWYLRMVEIIKGQLLQPYSNSEYKTRFTALRIRFLRSMSLLFRKTIFDGLWFGYPS